MGPNYYPEIDTIEFLLPVNTTEYQILVGSDDWMVLLDRFNIHYVVVTMARYSVMTREGHLKARVIWRQFYIFLGT